VQLTSRGGNLTNIPLRGVGGNISLLRPEIHIVAGRMLRPGVHELIVGRTAQAQYSGLGIGSHLTFQNGDWVIVGAFTSTRPSLLEADVLADGQMLLAAYQRNWFQAVTARLAPGPQSLEQLQNAIKADPTLHLTVNRESDYTAIESRNTSALLSLVGYFVGSMLAVGRCSGR
jgi:putative ABC transport system permease protein